MRAVDIIIKKRDKQELTSQEIDFFIQGFVSGDIPDYQASSFAMAILLNGMTPFETADLTLAMARSGRLWITRRQNVWPRTWIQWRYAG